MIKLNNKNITYVALADSNNSIKAPKEIWYADSNNSVKLVYRRKDALIEGEDYEKYHWLQGRNGAHINTMHPLTTYDDAFYVKAHFDGTIRNPNNEEQNIFGYTHLNNNAITDICRLYINSSGRISCNYYIPDGNWTPLPNSLGLTDIEVYSYAVGNNHYVNLNDTLHTLSTNGMQQQTFGSFIALFSNNGDDDNGGRLKSRYFHGDIASFRISDPTFTTDKMNLIPCKLLKPIPKWLDANGIRRQVGECGMIDLVSGKFYGNVNSVGTFTVENYYERKEWLVGDGSAYINTKVKLHFATDSVYIKGSKNGVATNKARFFGNYSGGENAKSLELIYYTSVQNDTVSKPFVIDGRFGINPSSEFEFYTTPFSSTTSVSVVYDNIDMIFNVNLDDSYLNYEASKDLILLNTNDTRYCMKADVANFKVMRSSTIILNLIPCTLTMDLPASMDANNIARTKGTSGMWDLVSDKFYGNVANSGTFKAVNLAEGVDYEVHDWLQGRNGAYINTEYIITTVEDILEGKIRYDGTIENPDGGKQYICGMADIGTNKPYVYVYISNTNKLGCIYKLNNSQWDYTTVANEHTFRMSNDGNNTTVTDNEVVYLFNNQLNRQTTKKCFLFNYNRGDTESPTTYFHGDIAYFKITDTSSNTKMNLVPVKLLRSIPSKYDANGIARQAGECGMYDTVNDLFYGNVASSGTFTVSDDN